MGETVGATKALAGLGPWYAAIAGTGMIIAAMYLLYMLGRAVWGPLIEPHGHASHGAHAHGGGHGDSPDAGGSHSVLPTDLNLREILTLAPLAVLCVFLGVYPKPAMDLLEPSLSRTVSIVEAANTHRVAPASPQNLQAAAESAANNEVTP
jgi:NADH-quinone oxidoreductase subunit M